ncbi:MAG TPA: hypothetical protein DEP48_04640 [Persephonella sp.]|uniref:Uncharacterized protein n=1 Tax=Persephonella marina (strain DSM 14350 / EX-H1) TaxID=123214 RepID=C0QQ14_PERMH|nr:MULTISPECIES: hypothetical protein [Persephonella]ACO03712.1 hypothetical protein PERMA_0974 [Persephonella marina EX-H1]HCB69625.1 hypothetical protein [Persephonella sp.]
MKEKSYAVYITISILIGINLILMLSFQRFDGYLREKERELRHMSDKVRLIKENINEIIELKNILNLKYVKKEEAEEIILNKLDSIKRIYPVKIIEGPEVKEGSVYVKLSLSLKPKSSKELIDTILLFEQSMYPVAEIEKFFLNNDKNGTTVNMMINLTQPYYGGT